MFDRIEVRAKRAIEEKVFPGCIIGIVHADGARHVFPFGCLAYGASEQVTESTLYDLASITKSIPTASLAASFVSEKKLAFSDVVKHHIPELANDQGATIEDLLHYRVKGAQLSKLPYKTFEEIRTHVFEHGFEEVSRDDGVHTNLPALILGIILERVGGKSVHVLAHEHFFGPLGMENTTFFPDSSVCVPTEIDVRGEVCGLPHDESAYLFAAKRRSVGHAGLFSTTPDLLKFLDALLKGRFPHIVECAKKGLGWQVDDPNFMGHHAGPGVFGKTGFTGTSVVCDTERGVGFVILSNRTFPKRPPDSRAITAFRRDIADIIFENIAE